MSSCGVSGSDNTDSCESWIMIQIKFWGRISVMRCGMCTRTHGRENRAENIAEETSKLEESMRMDEREGRATREEEAEPAWWVRASDWDWMGLVNLRKEDGHAGLD